jgi:hypothetical protein
MGKNREKFLRYYSDEELKEIAKKKYGHDLSDFELDMYINGCHFVNSNIDIEDCWNELSWFEQERFIEDHQDDFDFEEDYDYEEMSLYDLWNLKTNSEQLGFLCDKLKEFFPHEIVNKLKNKEIINDLYKELHN